MVRSLRVTPGARAARRACRTPALAARAAAAGAAAVAATAEAGASLQLHCFIVSWAVQPYVHEEIHLAPMFTNGRVDLPSLVCPPGCSTNAVHYIHGTGPPACRRRPRRMRQRLMASSRRQQQESCGFRKVRQVQPRLPQCAHSRSSCVQEQGTVVGSQGLRCTFFSPTHASCMTGTQAARPLLRQ